MATSTITSILYAPVTVEYINELQNNHNLDTYVVCDLIELISPYDYENTYKQILSFASEKITILTAAIILKQVELVFTLIKCGVTITSNMVRLSNHLCKYGNENNADQAIIYHLLLVNIQYDNLKTDELTYLVVDCNQNEYNNEDEYYEILYDTMDRYYKRRHKYFMLDDVGKMLLVSSWPHYSNDLIKSIDKCIQPISSEY